AWADRKGPPSTRSPKRHAGPSSRDRRSPENRPCAAVLHPIRSGPHIELNDKEREVDDVGPVHDVDRRRPGPVFPMRSDLWASSGEVSRPIKNWIYIIIFQLVCIFLWRRRTVGPDSPRVGISLSSTACLRGDPQLDEIRIAIDRNALLSPPRRQSRFVPKSSRPSDCGCPQSLPVPMRLILASASPIRATLLRNAGLDPDVRPARIDEAAIRAALEAEGAEPRALADALAEMKARRVSDGAPGMIVLGCDQVLALGGRVFSKPATPE